MQTGNRTSALFAASIAMMAVLSFSASQANPPLEGHHHAQEHRHEQIGNPLLEEMGTLDAVFRDVISGVALGDGRRVHQALEKMQGTMEKTHEGVAHGTVTLSKNADRMKEFADQDKQFHAKLEDLAAAAGKNDGNAMLTLTKDLFDRCVKCHRDFRQP